MGSSRTPATARDEGTLQALRRLSATPGCRQLLLTRAASLIGDFMTPIALVFAVLDTLHGNATDVGFVIAPVVGGTMLAVLLGGVTADRVSPLRVMAAADAVRFVVQTATCVSLVTHTASVWQLACLSFMLGLSGGMFTPASRAAWPRFVGRDDLLRVNALLGLLAGVGVVAGPAVAAGMLAVTNPGWVIGIDGITFLLSAVVLCRMPRNELHPSGPEVARPPTSPLRELRDGWRHVIGRPWLIALLAQAIILHLLVSGPLQVLGPTIAAATYHGAWGWSAFLGAAGVGAVLGGSLMLRFSPSRPLLTATLALLLLSPAPAALAMHMPIAIVVFGYALAGLAEAMYGALWNTALQQRVPIDVLARVSSYDSLVSLVALPLGTLAAGPAAAALGTSTTLAICALVVPLATLPVLLVNGIRSNAPQTSAPEPQIVAT